MTVNFVMDSWAVATYFDISLVPRDEAAFDDFRWDLIMQGVGPETILVHNSPDLAHFISTCTNPVHSSIFAEATPKPTNFAGDVPKQFATALGRSS